MTIIIIIIIIIIIKNGASHPQTHSSRSFSQLSGFFFSMWSLKNNKKINQRIGGQVQLSTMNTDPTRDYILILSN